MDMLNSSGSELPPSICLFSDTLLNEDALPHRSRREQGAGGHPVLSTGIVCVCICVCARVCVGVEGGGRDVAAALN